MTGIALVAGVADPGIQTESGWSAPVRLAASDGGHEDSGWISPDGQTYYFMYYPGNLFRDFERGKFVKDIDLYASDAPFRTRRLVKQHLLSEPVSSSAGGMIGADGAWYYHSNHHGLPGAKVGDHVSTNLTGNFTDGIYRNDQLIVFADGIPLGNPHYCAAKDELWFDKPQDQQLVVMKGAKAGGFKAIPQPAPQPIQAPGVRSSQAWLSADGNTLYYTSNCGDVPSQGPAIYRVERGPNGEWRNRRPVIWSSSGLGEASLPADGRRLYFIAIVPDGRGGMTTDMFYVERLRK